MGIALIIPEEGIVEGVVPCKVEVLSKSGPSPKPGFRANSHYVELNIMLPISAAEV